jgi:hypothetical protein
MKSKKITEIQKKMREVGVIFGYGVDVVKYGRWGEVICTPYREVEKKISRIFGESYCGQDTDGKFFFWPISEISVDIIENS